MQVNDPLLSRMNSLVTKWEAESDPKSYFLSCYRMMTSNMLEAIERDEFIDSNWVDLLLHQFAEYYFHALDAFEQKHTSAPAVWHVAHEAAYKEQITPLQKILIGVNAHINYDLVLVLVDLLGPEWAELSQSQREERYIDLRKVNQVIADTIDSIQDLLIEPVMPFMQIIDELMGSVDEYIVSMLITHWREGVWENAVHMMETQDPGIIEKLYEELVRNALRTASVICPGSRLQDNLHI